jgi:putative DNA methylase
MTYKKKLIEVALPLEAINKEAAREKSIRHGHPSTLHLWWARRPLAACRAVLFASLVDDPSECVAELMQDSAKRRAAEKDLRGRKKLWDEMTAVLEKARAGGISAPPPGPEPKLAEIIAEIERERLFEIIRELVKWDNSTNPRVIDAARAEIMRSCNGKPPPVYDPFCGGGSIPLEAQRLGLEAHASDLNPVPVLINKALIEIPPKFASKPPVNPEAQKKLSASGSWKGAQGLAEDIRYYGQWMRDEAEKRIGHLYPKVNLPKELGGGEATVIAWLWARTVASPNPAAKSAHVPLVRSFWLSTKVGKKVWIEPVVDHPAMSYHFEIRTGVPKDETAIKNGTKTARGANFKCVLTGTPIPGDYVKSEGRAGRLNTTLMAVVVEGATGRLYLPPDAHQQSVAYSANPQWTPDQQLPDDPRNIWCIPYGITHFKHLFTNRQLVTLATLCDLVPDVHKRITVDSGTRAAYADAVTTYLAFGISKSLTRNCTLAIWERGMNRLAGGLGRQAIQMQWDFAETNPFAGAGGDFIGTVESLCEVLDKLTPGKPGMVVQKEAQLLDEIEQVCFSTDPPYYDNISYADLSDFFYVWLRRSIGFVYPSLFQTVVTPKSSELVATPQRFEGDKQRAQDFFETGLSSVFSAMRKTAHPDYPTTVFYAFKQAEDDSDEDNDESLNEGRASTGWETMLAGLIQAGFSIDGTWPIRSEATNALKKDINALASSIVLVCRPRPQTADSVSRRDFLAALKRELPDALRAMQKSNIAPVDLAQAAIGPGIAVFSRYARVLETDGSGMTVRAALTEINKSLDEVLAEQEGEFDADTRWALAWFDQNGFNEGAYGVAETLCTAKNTSVQGMRDAGILEAKGGKVRLLKKEELDADWNPAMDSRLTIWEVTHHLIRRLEQGESGAAELILQLGAKAEIARDLSYRLYTICERRKWAQEAIGYNALVISWSDVQRLAQEKKATAPTQEEMTL